MIELNLLPDLKQDYIKAERARRLVISVSFIVSAACLGLLILLFSVSSLQKKHISDLTKDIASETSTLKKKPQINKILTVQNQLNSLTALHEGKPEVTRLFDYLNKMTPSEADITNLKIDFTQGTIDITGTADALSTVNKFADALKFTTYTSDTVATKTKAFKDVVLSSFGLTVQTQGKQHPANYTIKLSFDKNIFDNKQQVDFVVPNIITTREAIEHPDDLFQESVNANSKTQGSN